MVSIAQQLYILRRREEITLNKDWMTVMFEQISEKKLSFMVYYGLCVGDTTALYRFLTFLTLTQNVFSRIHV